MKQAAAIIGVLIMLVAPLAGCIGGGGSASDGPDEGPTSDDETPDDPTGEVNATARPHVHDRWQTPSGDSVEAITLVDREVAIEAYSQDRPLLLNFCEKGSEGQDVDACVGAEEFAPGQWSGDKAKIVPPGTGNISVTLEYSEGDFHRVHFYYMTRKDPGQWKSLGMFQTGKTKTISVGPEEADDGHAQVSGWRFLVEARGAFGTGATEGTLDAGDGEVSAEIVAHREPGELPLEPPHPDWWDKDTPPTDVYRIGAVDGSTDDYIDVGDVNLEPSEQPTPTIGPGLSWKIEPGFEGKRSSSADSTPKLSGNRTEALVPPQTKAIHARVAVSGDPGGLDQPMVCVYGQPTPSGSFPGRQIGCEPFEDGASYTFSTPIEDDETDSYYTKTNRNFSFSRWTFHVWIRPDNQQTHAARFSGSVTAEIFVVDELGVEIPAPEAGDGGSGDG